MTSGYLTTPTRTEREAREQIATECEAAAARLEKRGELAAAIILCNRAKKLRGES